VNVAAKTEQLINKLPNTMTAKNRIRLTIATSFLFPYHAGIKKASN